MIADLDFAQFNILCAWNHLNFYGSFLIIFMKLFCVILSLSYGPSLIPAGIVLHVFVQSHRRTCSTTLRQFAWNIFVSYRNAWDAFKIVAAAKGCVAARLLNGKLAQPLRRYPQPNFFYAKHLTKDGYISYHKHEFYMIL